MEPFVFARRRITTWKVQGLPVFYIKRVKSSKEKSYMVQNFLEKVSGGDQPTWVVYSFIMTMRREFKSTTSVRQIAVIKPRIRFSSKMKLTLI